MRIKFCGCKRAGHTIKFVSEEETFKLLHDRHTKMRVYKCKDCRGYAGFPKENFALVMNEGTAQAKERLIEIIKSNRQ